HRARLPALEGGDEIEDARGQATQLVLAQALAERADLLEALPPERRRAGEAELAHQRHHALDALAHQIGARSVALLHALLLAAARPAHVGGRRLAHRERLGRARPGDEEPGGVLAVRARARRHAAAAPLDRAVVGEGDADLVGRGAGALGVAE